MTLFSTPNLGIRWRSRVFFEQSLGLPQPRPTPATLSVDSVALADLRPRHLIGAMEGEAAAQRLLDRELLGAHLHREALVGQRQCPGAVPQHQRLPLRQAEVYRAIGLTVDLHIHQPRQRLDRLIALI